MLLSDMCEYSIILPYSMKKVSPYPLPNQEISINFANDKHLQWFTPPISNILSKKIMDRTSLINNYSRFDILDIAERIAEEIKNTWNMMG